MRKISFCTTCKGRLWQLEQTLSKNIVMLDDDCEIVLLDYQSEDGLKDYIFNNFSEYLGNKLKYYCMEENYNFTMSYAKNVVHKLASGEILFNLDADNLIHETLINELRELKDHHILIPKFSSHLLNEGSYGRLGYTRKAFYSLDGYNENIIGMKADDGDLVGRALKKDFLMIPSKTVTEAIQNTKAQKELYTDILINPPNNYPSTWGNAKVINYLTIKKQLNKEVARGEKYGNIFLQ